MASVQSELQELNSARIKNMAQNEILVSISNPDWKFVIEKYDVLEKLIT